ncbi:type II restriction endonuclease [Propionivibrio sp.]|uniref:type II restriction endonuclease n=1 Tax=Propionivibrio sp. TaxID=2212460 RepID=UPI003BF167A8
MVSTPWLGIHEWITKSSRLLIKKLSRNDCSWADDRLNGHQNGVYIPREIREAGFFPTLRNENPKKPHIYISKIKTFWPATGEIKESCLRHFSNKGTEMHFTVVPKDEFAGLTPASLLVGGLLQEPIGDSKYWFMTIDSASEEAELLETQFDLGVEFHCALFEPKEVFKIQIDETEELINELNEAIRTGILERFVALLSRMPTPEYFALEAQRRFLCLNGLELLDPYAITCPGDALMTISRDIEYALYKRAERRYRAAEVIRIINNRGSDLVTSVVLGYPELDATFLSASQQRKSRAGRSFEQHIARLFRDGCISFQEQAVMGGRRPDFVLPNLITLKSNKRTFNEALILSAKTTLRERWKQLVMEKFNCALFFATVDDRVSDEAISDMNKQGIQLVVPESLKNSKEACYAGKSNVISFREFFDSEISTKRGCLRSMLLI